jgi:hypothetical protein
MVSGSVEDQQSWIVYHFIEDHPSWPREPSLEGCITLYLPASKPAMVLSFLFECKDGFPLMPIY